MKLPHTPKLTSEVQSSAAPTNPSVKRAIVKLSTIISALITSACQEKPVDVPKAEPELVSSSTIIEPKKPLEPKKAKVERNEYARLVGHSKIYPEVAYPDSFDKIQMRQQIYDRAVAQEQVGMDNPDYDPELAAWLRKEREILSANASAFYDKMRHQEQWDKKHQDD